MSSVHDGGSLANLPRAYDWVNLKLDKTGGLTEALACAQAAKSDDANHGRLHDRHLALHGTSHGARAARRFGRFDGPLWLAEDRPMACAMMGRPFIRQTRKL